MPKILIIEANPLMRDKVAAMLKLAHCEVLTAPNGIKGIEIARRSQPDLIVCDVDLPGLNGYNVLVAVRAIARLAQVPFVLMSAWSDVEEITYALSLGANDFIVKTLLPDRLLAVVQRHVAI